MTADTLSVTPRHATPRPHPAVVVALAACGAVVVNEVLYIVGRSAGGTYRYRQNGRSERVDAIAIVLLTIVPLIVGLAGTALLSRKWPRVIGVAQVVAPVLAIASIAAMTVPAHFDTTSTLCLAATHIAVIPFAIAALRTLKQQQGRTTSGPPEDPQNPDRAYSERSRAARSLR